MAWYEGTMTKAAGALITELDLKLPLNAKWTVYDSAAGTNCKVYRNYDAAANVDYYVKVDDNYADYAIIQLWQGWNAVTHVGIGQSLTTISGFEMRMWKEAGGYGLSVRDHRFIYADFVYYRGIYIGQLVRYDTTKNMPIYIGGLSGFMTLNPLGYYRDGGDTCGWACLFDEGGTVRNLVVYGSQSYELRAKTIAGNYLVFECPVRSDFSGLMMGALDGVAYYFNSSNQAVNGDIVTLNGVDWIFLGHGNFWSLVRKN